MRTAFTSFNLRLWSKEHLVAWLGLLVIILPVIRFGPWIPFPDLIAFAGLYSYPPRLSYGPFHYYVFQFTYILPPALSRLFVDFGLSVSTQICLLYLFQALALYWIIWSFLRLLLPDGFYRQVFTVLGALAFWDGLFLWGGPLAFSLASILLAVVTYLSVREAQHPERMAPWPTSILTLLAVASHPFAVPFGCVLFGIRLLFLRRSRVLSASILFLLFLCQIVIRQENPNPQLAAAGTQLFAYYPEHLWTRLSELFLGDISKVEILFSVRPTALSIYFAFLGAIHLLGFIGCPLVAIVAKENRALRMLATLNTAVFGAYLFAQENAVISLWPLRILFVYSCVTYVGGVAALYYLLRRYAVGRRISDLLSIPGRLHKPILILLVVWLVALQVPILSLGRTVALNYNHLRATLLATGVRDSMLVVSNVNIQPWYLHGVPFLLFSDPAVVERNLILFTEWHLYPHQPTRVPEMNLMSGRPRYSVDYTMENGLIFLWLTRTP
jgi:hypothetical protein